ncbi:3-phenylpropionate MFS transporter [Alphaproteobacteria bacterium]|nr:3-phenylpropionate MFS transporter [Alphaproteobacteria bacterium]
MAFRLSFFFAAIFLVVGIMLPFWPIWLKSRGLTETEIGLLLSAGMWVRAFTNPLLAQLADRRGRPDQLLIALGWGALISHLFYVPFQGFWPLLIVSIVAYMLFSPLMSLGDAVTMLKVRDGMLDYGRVRLWGSLTFILAATLGGYAIEGRPADVILWLVIGTLVLTVIACHFMPTAQTAGTKQFFAPLREIVRNRKLIVFMLAAGLLQASHGVYYGFAALHWKAAGLSAGVIGALWAEGVIAEIILFTFSARLVKLFGPIGLLWLAGIAGLIRWCTLGTTEALPILIAVQGLHAFTFGAAHIAAMHYIAATVPASYGATAQSLYSSTAQGCIMAASMLASGWLFGNFGGSAFFVMAIISLAGGLLAVPLWVKDKQWP